jgi:hypothetical protein
MTVGEYIGVVTFELAGLDLGPPHRAIFKVAALTKAG